MEPYMASFDLVAQENDSWDHFNTGSSTPFPQRPTDLTNAVCPNRLDVATALADGLGRMERGARDGPEEDEQGSKQLQRGPSALSSF